MIFTSIAFAVFLPVVFFIYWFATRGSLKLQNMLLLFSSYFFYASWDWRFLFLLIFSTLAAYLAGIRIHEASDLRHKRFWLWLSVFVNLGFLGFFKYYNFFIYSFSSALTHAGISVNLTTLQIILPLGISFYTFHNLSYVIDLYKNKIKPERNVINYGVFVSFFPLLIAGPIERATHLLPQIVNKREFDASKVADGLRQILWGLFKKIVIADNCAEFVNVIFDNSADYSGSTLALGAVFFSLQIYCDFSGYSDIALGTARLFGIDLLRNFSFPYFSRSVPEFWRRWHISLTTWFRDYLYIPLGGSRGGLWMKIRNIFIIFLVSGLWHGANWTFVIWGFLNALYMMPSIIFNTNQNSQDIAAKGKFFSGLKSCLSIIATFCLTSFAWIFFRSLSVTQAFNYVSKIFSASLFTMPDFPGVENVPLVIVLIMIFMIVEWIGRENQYALEKLGLGWSRLSRWIMYILIIDVILVMQGQAQQFIYFQF